MGTCDVAALGEHQADTEVGNGAGVSAADIEDDNPAVGRRRDVDMFTPRAAGAHDLQARARCVHDLAGHRAIVDKKHPGTGYGLHETFREGNGPRSAFFDLDALLLQPDLVILAQPAQARDLGFFTIEAITSLGDESRRDHRVTNHYDFHEQIPP